MAEATQIDLTTLTNENLAARHAETLFQAKARRAAGDLQTAAMLVEALRPMNAEMARRMGR